jgi:hypothetical protein
MKKSCSILCGQTRQKPSTFNTGTDPLNAKASPEERYMSIGMCSYPLSGNIGFHPPYGRLPTIRASLGAGM